MYSKINFSTGKTTVFSRAGLTVVAISALSVAGCDKPDLPGPIEEQTVELSEGLKMTGSRLSFAGPREFEESLEQLQANPGDFGQKLSEAGFKNASHHLDHIAKKRPESTSLRP